MTLTDIAGYLPHGLIGYHHQGAICKIDMAFAAKYGVALCNYRPVLRPMTDLSSEIIDNGYYGGKPFVPIVELAKLMAMRRAFMPLNAYRIVNTKSYVGVTSNSPDYIFAWDLFDKNFNAWWIGVNDVECGDSIVIPNVHELYDYLYRWHFDYRGLIEAGEAVNVHELKKDPYQ